MNLSIQTSQATLSMFVELHYNGERPLELRGCSTVPHFLNDMLDLAVQVKAPQMKEVW
jgi:hypothetical protein